MSYVPLPAYDSHDARNPVEYSKNTCWTPLARCYRSLHRGVVLFLWLTVVSLVTALAFWPTYKQLPLETQSEIKRAVMLGSIPVVALFFTWFHIWLAIQMMFRPLNFIGCCQFGEGIGFGWQGVVPRKALKMAKTAYACARPHLMGPSAWFDRCDPGRMCSLVEDELRTLVHETLTSVGSRHFPGTLKKMPPAVLEELTTAAVELCAETSADLWRDITAFLSPTDGLDNDGMVVALFMSKKQLLCDFFQKVGYKEFLFIENCGALLGFVCGLIQLLAYEQLSDLGRAILLPSTGFFLGIFTNWLAILVCFWPCFPYNVTICCWTFRVQGLFLARQPEASEMYSRMLTDNFFNFDYVVSYLQTRPELWTKLKNVYVRYNRRIFSQALGAARYLAPLAVGRAEFEAVQEEITVELVTRIGGAHKMHKIIEAYIEDATQIHRDNTQSMRKMSPDQFENLLHPVFKEDEWILILLGGVLGAIVGFGQIYVLGE